MSTEVYFIFTSIVLFICIRVNLGTIPSDFQQWNPKYAERNNMKCPHSICNEYTTSEGSGRTMEGCCVCHAKPLWEIPPVETKPVHIEYYRRNGHAILLNINSGENPYLHIEHSNGFLAEIPRNLCDFRQLVVKIKLMHNWISDIGDISCLLMLDTLDLSYNSISFISNKTFVGLKKLRVLKITNNNLQTLQPSAITGPSLQIYRADFSQNDMRTIEVSNMISEHDFCHYDFSSNKIKEMINTNHFTIDPKKTYQGGMVSLTGNTFTKFIDFEKLGITDISILGKVFTYGFDMRGAKWDCDCHMEPYLEHFEDVVKKLWRDYFNITCWNPPEYRGQSIPDMIKAGQLDLFICNITAKDKCPKDCYCFYQPKESRTVVNCTDAGLKELPLHVPEMDKITLILKNNSIKHFKNRDYLKNVTVLDFADNRLESISADALKNLPKGIPVSFKNNNLKTIPREVQIRNPCAIELGRVTTKCECDQVWIKDWLENRRAEKCSNSTMYICETNNGYTPANEVSRDDFCPVEHSSYNLSVVILSILCILLSGISSFLYFFRYEIYLVKRNFLPKKSLNKVGLMNKYDAFVSFDEDNVSIRSWILNVLSVNLSASGYRIFVPCRDLSIGGIKEQEILSKILSSRNYIIILSENYSVGNTIWTEIEWKYIWHTFKANAGRNIIIINFDQFETSYNMDLKLRAFIRLGYDIDFSNRDHGLLQQVKDRLGAPCMFNKYNNRNRNTKFSTKVLKQKEYMV